jgi:hypothetical protein
MATIFCNPPGFAANAGPLRTEIETFLPCRGSPEPLELSIEQVEWLRQLGPCLLSFYAAMDKLYLLSVRGEAPPWVAGYLDNGKPESIVALGRQQAVAGQFPALIRPDVLLGESGSSICELDSVPGGFGLAGRLSACYQRAGFDIIEDVSIEAGFASAIGAPPLGDGKAAAIVVSDESAAYRGEMDWLAGRLRAQGAAVYAVHPRQLYYTQDGASLETATGVASIPVLYRFFELFDLANIARRELLSFLVTGRKIRLTPPPKAYLEEKMWFAFFHHPVLQCYWLDLLGATDFALLQQALPRTWLVDPTPLPGHAVIPGLTIASRPVQGWGSVRLASKADRKLVLKPSGFSELAWGSRGVVIGHDESASDWASAIDRALVSYPRTTWILQEFRPATRRPILSYDQSSQDVIECDGRARITPFYVVRDGRVELSTVLATICPADKKKIHGMRDAIMTVCTKAAKPPDSSGLSRAD